MSENLNVLEKPNHLGKTMLQCLEETMTHLCNSPYIDRARLERTQVPVVKQVLESYMNKRKAFILEAPTGVGKSIIGIMIAETISRYCGYKSVSPSTYMLTSSKMLQDQLDRDKDNFKIRWAVLKGQANYQCTVNAQPFTKRECKDMSVSAAEKDMECAGNCPYIIARRKAMSWDSAILSYAYWLTSMNFVYEFLGSYAPFQKRHITIFDEAHMLSEIVCGMFSNQISEKIIESIRKYRDTFNFIMPKVEDQENLYKIVEDVSDIIPKLLNKTLSVQEMFDFLIVYNEVLKRLKKFIVSTKNRYLKEDSKLWSKEQRKFEKESETMETYCIGVGYFIDENESDIGMIVKTYDDEIDDKTGKTTVKMTLRSLREQHIIKEHCHKYTDFAVFMSATIGDADVFASNNGIEDYDYLYIDSDFKFESSPIFQVGPPISMAYKEKQVSMPELMLRIDKICNEIHPNERGIIHTGNFEISYKFKEYLWENSIPGYKRFLFYKTSVEKDEAIKKLAKSKNGIIIGPSLTEGLDLKDDLARFCILAKVPYPMLDEYNSKKMKLIEGWYQWKTVTSILQALGRPIRHREDWAYTYLLDSCFDLVFKYNRVPPYITRRFDNYPMGMLNQQKTMESADALGLFDYGTENQTQTTVSAPVKTKWELDLEYYREHGVMPGDEPTKNEKTVGVDFSKQNKDPLFNDEPTKGPWLKDSDDDDDLPF